MFGSQTCSPLSTPQRLRVKPSPPSGAAEAVDHHLLDFLCCFGLAFPKIHVLVWLTEHALETGKADVSNGPTGAEFERVE